MKVFYDTIVKCSAGLLTTRLHCPPVRPSHLGIPNVQHKKYSANISQSLHNVLRCTPRSLWRNVTDILVHFQYIGSVYHFRFLVCVILQYFPTFLHFQCIELSHFCSSVYIIKKIAPPNVDKFYKYSWFYFCHFQQ